MYRYFFHPPQPQKAMVDVLCNVYHWLHPSTQPEGQNHCFSRCRVLISTPRLVPWDQVPSTPIGVGVFTCPSFFGGIPYWLKLGWFILQNTVLQSRQDFSQTRSNRTSWVWWFEGANLWDVKIFFFDKTTHLFKADVRSCWLWLPFLFSKWSTIL